MQILSLGFEQTRYYTHYTYSKTLLNPGIRENKMALDKLRHVNKNYDRNSIKYVKHKNKMMFTPLKTINDNFHSKTAPAKGLPGSVGYRKYDSSLCKHFLLLSHC